MKSVQKFAGFIWMIMSPFLIAFMIWQAIEKTFAVSPGALRINTMVQWGIILAVFIPICIGFFIFGRYASQGAYDQQPENPDDL